MERADLGHDHQLELTNWDPDLKLNPGYAHLAGQLPAVIGAIVSHPVRPGDETCERHSPASDDEHRGLCFGVITFDVPVAHEAGLRGPFWTVESWDPLTLSPSLLCHCSDHGFIKEGKWVPA